MDVVFFRKYRKNDGGLWCPDELMTNFSILQQEGAPPVSAVQAGGSGEVGDSQASQGKENILKFLLEHSYPTQTT